MFFLLLGSKFFYIEETIVIFGFSFLNILHFESYSTVIEHGLKKPVQFSQLALNPFS